MVNCDKKKMVFSISTRTAHLLLNNPVLFVDYLIKAITNNAILIGNSRALGYLSLNNFDTETN